MSFLLERISLAVYVKKQRKNRLWGSTDGFSLLLKKKGEK